MVISSLVVLAVWYGARKMHRCCSCSPMPFLCSHTKLKMEEGLDTEIVDTGRQEYNLILKFQTAILHSLQASLFQCCYSSFHCCLLNLFLTIKSTSCPNLDCIWDVLLEQIYQLFMGTSIERFYEKYTCFVMYIILRQCFRGHLEINECMYRNIYFPLR